MDTLKSESNTREHADTGRRSFLWKVGAGMSAVLAATVPAVAKPLISNDKKLKTSVESLSKQVALLEDEKSIRKLTQLIRAYFRMDGHHIQFNVIDAATLRAARSNPEQYRDLIVRVAGYSDYFCDLSEELQEEIVQRTEHAGF